MFKTFSVCWRARRTEVNDNEQAYSLFMTLKIGCCYVCVEQNA